MPKTKAAFDQVREIALALPDVEEATAYGSPAFKVRGNLLACVAIHKSAEPDSLAVWIDQDQRAGLLADAPETYYVTPHYLNHPVVLVRLGRIRRPELRDLLLSSWRFVTALKNQTVSRSAGRGQVGGGKRTPRRSRQI